MAISLNACCRSLAPESMASTLSASNFSPSISSATKCQLGRLDRCTSSSVELQSVLSSNLRPLRSRETRQTVSLKQRRFSTICAAKPDLAGAAKSKIAPLTIRDAQIVAEPPQNKKLKIRVDIDAQASKRAFDTVLKELAKNAPPVPGFRKAKGDVLTCGMLFAAFGYYAVAPWADKYAGKTSIVPLNVVYQLMGPKLVRKFVVEEIIKATLQDYVQKEGIKVNNELKTDQSSEELDAVFEPGKVFGFDATLDLADEPAQDSEAAVTADEKESAAEPLEASV